MTQLITVYDNIARRSLTVTREHKGFKKQVEKGYPLQENYKTNKNFMSMYTTHDTILMTTD